MNTPKSDSLLLTVKEAALELRLHYVTVYRMVEEGTIPSVRIGRTVRIRRSNLIEFLDKMALEA